jgi:hypothetical protein
MAKKKSRRVAGDSVEALVFVACDSVSRDPNTGKPSLYGLFDIIWSSTFPFHFKPFSLYAQLGGKGKHRLSVHLVDPGGQSTKLGETEVRLERKANAVLHADLTGVEFKRPGEYRFVLRAGRKTLGHRILNVRRKARARRKK